MKKYRGYTLLELMIVVAVIALLLSLALPSFQEQIRKARRGDAQGALTGLSVAVERYYTIQSPSTYVGALTTGGSPVFPSEAPLDGNKKYYDLAVTSQTVSAYSLTAAPKGAQSGDKCGTLTLTSSGQRGITGGAAGVTWQDCWE